MFPYRIKYTESEYDIQKNDLLYKIDHKGQNTFESLEQFENSKTNTLFYNLYKSHNSYFVILGFGDFWIFYMFGFMF